jgi:hypothetical protein
MGPDLLLIYSNNIIEKDQGQTPSYMLIWVLFLAKNGKKLKYKIMILSIFWNFFHNCSIFLK